MSSPPHPPDPTFLPPNTSATAPIFPAPATAIPFAARPTSLTSTVTTSAVHSPSNFPPNPSYQPQQQQIPHTLPTRPKSSPHGGFIFSSGRGFIAPKHLGPSEQAVTIASPNLSNLPVMPFHHSQHLLRPTHAVTSVALPTSAHPKVTPSPSLSSKSAANGFKDPRDRGKDDALIVVRDRKVRLSDGDSLYGLGRSWLRNGFPEERMGWQSRYGDFAKSLPSPLPVTEADSHSLKEEVEEEENKEDNVEGLSAKDLLKGHIKHAKRVRLRAKEERMKRISRFRTRITLLLPPPEVEQFRNDSASGT